jgi:hypothetical protein
VSITHLPADGTTAVQISGDSVTVRDLTVVHPEAAALLLAQEQKAGPEVVADLVRRALPVGLISLSMGTAAVDSGGVTRVLDSFADRLDLKSRAALASLDGTLNRLATGEQSISAAANAVLSSLPSQVEQALAGEAETVRAAVLEATRAVQAAGIEQMGRALAEHTRSLRDAVSLERGPVQTLRQDMLNELAGTRRELSEQLTAVRVLVESAKVHKDASAKNSRAIGAVFEDEAMAMCHEIVTAAGDMFEATGGQAGVGGTTRRSGDGVATLSPAIVGHGPAVRIVIEAKRRTSTRPLTAKAFREEIEAGRRVRDAAGGLVLVPTREEVPGGGTFARVCQYGYVVAIEDTELVRTLFLLLREQVAVLCVRQNDDTEIDLSQVEARLNQALSTLAEFDEVGRLAGQARRSLEKLSELGAAAQKRLRATLTEGVNLLHP